MESAEIPERSSLWLEAKEKVEAPWYLMDAVTILFSLFVGLFAAIIYWPSVSSFTFEEAYFTPLLPSVVNVLSTFTHSFNDSLKFIYTFSFGLSTVSIYLLVRDMTKKQLRAVLASVIFLIPAVPIFFLTNFFPEKSSELFLSAYSFFSIVYGDSSIFLSLALIPLIIIFFARYLAHSTASYFAPTVILCSLILLLSRTQAVNLLLVLVVVSFNSLLLGNAKLKLRRLLFVSVFSIGLVTFWYTPAFWLKTFLLNETVINNLRYIFPLPMTIGLVGVFLSIVFFGRREERRLIFISFLVFSLFGAVLFDWLVNGRSFIPYPHRLIPIVSLFGSVVLSISLTAFLNNFSLVSYFRNKIKGGVLKLIASYAVSIISFIVFGLLAFVLSPLVLHFLSSENSPWQKIKSEVILEKQSEIQMAGGNFRLSMVNASDYQLIAGAVVSVFFVFWLTLLVFYGIFILRKKVNAQ